KCFCPRQETPKKLSFSSPSRAALNSARPAHRGASSGDVRLAERDAAPLRPRFNVSRGLGGSRSPALRLLRAVREELAIRRGARALRTQARSGISGEKGLHWTSRQNAAVERRKVRRARKGAPNDKDV